jgi:phosphoenolpyruvate carboxykinase (GTP)
VPIDAIIFGGRRPTTMPLVFQSRNWQHGVFVGATMGSETTAAATGAVGVVRRDPMAMLPFCGYNVGDYFAHWLSIGAKSPRAPKIFHVNWFRQGEDGKFLWPGFGENLRVLRWILGRCDGSATAVESPIGFVPTPDAIDTQGLDLAPGAMEKLIAVDREEWRREVALSKEFFDKLGERLPAALRDEHAALAARVG